LGHCELLQELVLKHALIAHYISCRAFYYLKGDGVSPSSTIAHTEAEQKQSTCTKALTSKYRYRKNGYFEICNASF